VRARLSSIRERLGAVLARARTGAVLREGLTVVLVGAPNVGKSSLLNRLAGDDVAIVTAIPGTTRDTIERPVEIAGIPLTIVDTAGLRETRDTVEALGIARTRAAIARADLALLLVDARDDAASTDETTAASLDARIAALVGELPPDLPRIVVHNKCDLARVAPRAERAAGKPVAVWLCALSGDGIALLETEVRRIAGVGESTEGAFFARARQVQALTDAAQHLEVAAAHAESVSPPIELFAEELRMAQDAVSSITGEFTADDLLGEIFSRFCIGK